MKILIIQTAFIGDVVLATALVEKLHAFHPNVEIHFLLRRGNESLLSEHPKISKVLIWDKKHNKYNNLLQLLVEIRSAKYDAVVNCQRFAASGFLTGFSGAKSKLGFEKNPFSLLFSESYPHKIGKRDDVFFMHEVERNQLLISGITDHHAAAPKLYPTADDFTFVAGFKEQPYVTICPASVWKTKELPVAKWLELIKEIPASYKIYLLGASGDKPMAEQIVQESGNAQIANCCGAFSFLQTAALMKDAAMNYTNDSAPLHFASAMNASVTAVFCSTVPQFGFGPLSAESHLLEEQSGLYCRPCGLHGYKNCPEKHFDCAKKINMKTFLTG